MTLFAEKMAGGTDDDDVILKSFDAFEVNGKIDAEMLVNIWPIKNIQVLKNLKNIYNNQFEIVAKFHKFEYRISCLSWQI